MALSSTISAQAIEFADANFKAKLLTLYVKDLNGVPIKIDVNNNKEIEFSEASQVSEISIYGDQNKPITNLQGLQYFNNLHDLSLGNLDITTLNLSNLNLLKNLALNSLIKAPTLSLPANVENLRIYDSPIINNANIQNLTNLKTLYLINSISNITSFDISNFKFLKEFQCSNDSNSNKLTEINVSGLPSLESLNCQDNNLTNLNFTGTNNLKELNCSYNKLTAIDISSLTDLQYFNCSYNEISSLDVSKMKSGSISCNNNKLQSLDLRNLQLGHISAYNNEISNINLDNAHFSFGMNFYNNKLTTLDLSKYSPDQYPTSEILQFGYNQLTHIFLKNGADEGMLSFSNNPNLKYICADEDEIESLNYRISEYGYTQTNINSFCSFVPGGKHNTIAGNVKFDEDGNGCNETDDTFKRMKLKINDGTNSGSTFVDGSGKYQFYTESGNFAVTALPENPALFQIAPAQFSTSFADDDNHTFTQNLCVSKTSNQKDLEIIFAPISTARPGFNATYKLMWRNKGNTTISGDVFLVFENLKMNYVSSTIPVSALGNTIKHSISNLKPYEDGAMEIVFQINPPTHATNPVNIDDKLNFIANAPIEGDVFGNDNLYPLQQIVRGSYDPNDIVCLEGEMTAPEKIGNYLHYIINFENTGNEAAENVVVEMDINPEFFDIETLQIQNTSHSVFAEIKRFFMENIQLGAGKHGNIILKMKTINTLQKGDKVMNNAKIYFDYNFPIVTNDAITEFNETTLQTSSATDKSVKIYPIPAKEYVFVEADSKISAIEMYDLQGKMIGKQNVTSPSKKVQLSLNEKNPGVYLLKIKTEKGLITTKIIKQ